MTTFERGSEWRKWDLHVHTPASHDYRGSYDDLIKTLNSCEAEVIGLNDYCTISGYEEIVKRKGVKNKALFPVIEFRMQNIIASRKDGGIQGGPKINFHVIFNNGDNIVTRVKTWLMALECYNEKGITDQLGNISPDKYEFIVFDFKHVIRKLKELQLKDDALIWLPYDEYGGIDDINPNDSFFKLGLIRDADIIGSSTQKQIDFFLWNNKRYTKERYKSWFKKPLPCIKGSDAHDANYPCGKLRDKDSKPADKYCWIKADPTFEGLKQILNDPEDRVYIGNLPPKLMDVHLNKPKYIDSIKINHISPAPAITWFKNHIPLNNGLVAIIGKKGSGKSALADIISLAGKSHIKPNDYSFLNDKKFRKRNLAKSYEATLKWLDGPEITTTLEKNVEEVEVEKVKYLPQQFVETICNEQDGVSKLFQEEIDKVIFSYVPPEDRNEATNLHELIKTKTEVIDEAISELRVKLHDTNYEIVLREGKSQTVYKEKIEAKLREREREVLNLAKPKEVKKPTTVDDITQKQVKELNLQIEQVDKEIKDNTSVLTDTNTKYTKLLKLEAGLEQLKIKVKDYLDKFSDEAEAVGVDLASIVDLEIKDTTLQAKKEQLLKSKQSLEAKLDKNSNDQKKSLYAQRAGLQTQLDKISKTLDRDQKLYQDYLANLKKYNEDKEILEGKKDDPAPETVRALKNELLYLSKQLKPELDELYLQRTSLTRRVFKKLTEKISFFKEIYQPLIEFVKGEKGAQERAGSVLTFDVDPAFNKADFSNKFLSFINQHKDGSFQGKEPGFKILRQILDKFDPTKESGILSFLKELFEHLTTDKTKENCPPTDLDSQLNNNEENKTAFYDFVYGLEYLNIKYKILFNGKDLNDNEFSPGEKGTLLLIFYLLIDKDTIPLIMDQPEENLDNESVFTLLVPYIKKAKRKRQILIVTHNPNLAVVCDAEQIIAASMNKKTDEIRYISGSIENPTINKKVVDVLEGTMPAFNIRDNKYIKDIP